MLFPPPSPTGIITGAAISLGFATATLVLRLITRARIVGVVEVEDGFLVAALVLSACHVAGVAYQVRFGLGTNVSTLDPEQIELFLKALFASILCYVSGHTLTKVSILCLYTRVFRTTRMRKVYLAMLVIIAVHGLYLVLSGIFGCTPVRAFWDISLPRNCLPRKPMWFSNAAVNILTDFALFLTPLVVLKSMRLPKRQKIGLYVVFLLGFFVCLISLIRLYYLHRGAEAFDITMDIAGVSMWSAIELNIAIMCACLMVMKPLVVSLFPRLFLAPPNNTESFPFSYVTPPTISGGCTTAGILYTESASTSPPPSQGDCSSRTGLTVEDIRHQRRGSNSAHYTPGA